MTKSELRKIYLERRKNFAPIVREAESIAIAEMFFARFDLTGVRFLHCFLPIEKFSEIDTRFIFKRLWSDFSHVQTLAPRVNFQTSAMESLILTAQTATAANAWNIEEPARSKSVEAKKIDVVLIPLLCFDERGFRVGYGKGFYDKFLKTCRADCLKIGLNYFAPETVISDAKNFDVKLDFCVTPRRIYEWLS